VRISINLATRPYVELERILKPLRIVLGVLAVLAVVLGIFVYRMNLQAKEQQRQVALLDTQANRLERERSANEAQLRQPVNAATLSRNQFLNTLFLRKSFSWTAVLMDLESVLPRGVQVASIEPVVSAAGGVTIRLRVLGDRDRTVQLVRNLEGSKYFIAPQLAGEAQQTAERGGSAGRTTIGANGLPQLVNAAGGGGLQAASGVEFEIVSGYNPLQALAKAGNRGARPADEKSAPAAKAPGPLPGTSRRMPHGGRR
jgi:type IV pilus assembly protein PilN